MSAITDFREKFKHRVRSRPLCAVPEMTDQGIVLGADTILLAADEQGGNRRSDDADLRLLALLGAAYRRRVSSDVIAHVRKASVQWASGKKSLARIHLAFAGLPRLESREDAFQLFWADELINAGVAPSALLNAVDTRALDLRKFNPNQPRVPAGNGRESGRWGSGGGDTSHLVTHRSAALVHFDKDRAIWNDIVTIAQTHVGSTAWADETTNGNFEPGSNKCNKFVYDVLTAAGASPGEPNHGELQWWNKYPPTAAQWADPNYNIPGWDVLGSGDTPLPGDVVAQQIGYVGRATGHVMIVGADGTVIGTGDSGPGPEGTIEVIPMPARLGPQKLVRGPLVFRRWHAGQ